MSLKAENLERAKELIGDCTCGFLDGFSWKGGHAKDCLMERLVQALTEAEERGRLEGLYAKEKELERIRDLALKQHHLILEAFQYFCGNGSEEAEKHMMDRLEEGIEAYREESRS